MRLLCVIDNLSTGGSQRQMVNLALGLHMSGHHVEFFCYMPGDLLAAPLYAAGIPVHTHLKLSRYSPDVILALLKRLRGGEYDLVLSFLPTPNFYAVVSTRLMRKRPRLVLSERSFDPPTGISKKQALIRQLYRFADYIVINSHHQRKNFSRKYSWLHSKIDTIYNGVALDVFSPPDDEPPDTPFKLLAIGSISPYKNGLCLIGALDILRRQYQFRPQVSWVGEHVTTLQDRHGYFSQMDQEVKTRNLTDQWTWLYQRTDIVELLHQHHALVHPSYWEGLPNVVCEALACGRPVLVSDTLDHPLLVEHGVSGFRFDWRSSSNLAEMIWTLYKMPSSQRQAMGCAGRQFARKNLSLPLMIDKYEQLFYSLLH